MPRPTNAQMATALDTIRRHVARAEQILAFDHNRSETLGGGVVIGNCLAFDFGMLEQTVKFVRDALDALDAASRPSQEEQP